MYKSEYFFSETTTTHTPAPAKKSRKIPVNDEVKPPAKNKESHKKEHTHKSEVKDKVSSSPTEREALLAGDIQRLQAEYVNYRKRVERDRDQARLLGAQATFEKIIPVLDDINAARKYGDLQDGPFASIANKLDTIVRELGFTVINQEGVAFDPTIHETVMVQPNPDMPADHIAKVLREGYLMGDKTIRPAQVMVSGG